MSLYIVTKEKKNIFWEIGDDTHKVLSILDNIETIMASGEELKLIKNTFSYDIMGDLVYSIPMPINLCDVIWHGDIAKTIISNIMI